MDIISGIYCVTNRVNGKKYIGKSVDIAHRWRCHQNDHDNPNSSQYNTYFYNALRKYGLDSLVFEIVEECSEDSLNDRERYWIAQTKSNNREFGYNTTDGGDGVCGYWDIPVYQYALDGTFIRSYKSISDAVRDTGYYGISDCSRGELKSSGGFMWSRIYVEKMEPYERGHRTTTVYQYGLSGDYIATYGSIKEAAEATGVDYRSISGCIHQKTEHKRGGDFIWTTAKVDKMPPYKRGLKRTPVIQKSLDGDFICEYESLNEAGRVVGIKSGNIYACCHGKAKTAGGYVWEYANK